jgi:uncharacterized membrane protein
MTEDQILNQFGENNALIFSLLQWWLSVSVGLVAAAHFFAKKLNLYLVVFLVMLYTCFSIYTHLFVTLTFVTNVGLIDALIAIPEDQISSAGRAFLSWPNSLQAVMGAAFALCVIGGFVGAVAYFIMSYRANRESG